MLDISHKVLNAMLIDTIVKMKKKNVCKKLLVNRRNFESVICWSRLKFTEYYILIPPVKTTSYR